MPRGANSASPPTWKPWPTNFRDVMDGTSNTFAIGEGVPRAQTRMWWYGADGDGTCGIPLNFALNVGMVTGVPGGGANGGGTPAQWPDSWQNNFGFNSEHQAGAFFAMVDGSTRYVSETIDFNLYKALATISSGETVSEF
jgi:hypothetical protein